MKLLSFIFASILALSIPAHAQDLNTQLSDVKTKTCESDKAYEHHGIKLGMSESELAQLGSEPVKVNFPSSGSSSVLVEEKTLIMWSTPETPDQPRYRIDYVRGAQTSFTLEQAREFVQERISVFGEPTIKGEGKSYLDAGFPTLFYGADKSIQRERFQAIRMCLRQHREISIYEQQSLESFTPRNFKTGLEGLRNHCPEQLGAYFDYVAYSLQPEVYVTTGKAKFVVQMKCPAHQKINEILASPSTELTPGRGRR